MSLLENVPKYEYAYVILGIVCVQNANLPNRLLYVVISSWYKYGDVSSSLNTSSGNGFWITPSAGSTPIDCA